jgi:hypothetical protein
MDQCSLISTHLLYQEKLKIVLKHSTCSFNYCDCASVLILWNVIKADYFKIFNYNSSSLSLPCRDSAISTKILALKFSELSHWSADEFNSIVSKHIIMSEYWLKITKSSNYEPISSPQKTWTYWSQMQNESSISNSAVMAIGDFTPWYWVTFSKAQVRNHWW